MSSFKDFQISYIYGKTGNKEEDKEMYKTAINKGDIPVAEFDNSDPALQIMKEVNPNIKKGIFTIRHNKKYKA